MTVISGTMSAADGHIPPLRANAARMRREFEAQARIGRYGKTGLVRVAFTPEYNEVRTLVAKWMRAAGLQTRVDAVGNLFGRKPGTSSGLPAVMTGSHLDTQRPGGRFDGIAGVLGGLEAVRRIGESGIRHDHPIEVVAFIGEESSCGLNCFGSRVLVGRVDVAAMRAATHPPTGRSVYEAVRAAGGNPIGARACRLPRGYLKAFVELHIEQGPVLDLRRVPIGIVDVIAGRRWGEIVLDGVTAHSGGQPMRFRKDAAMAAATLMVEAEAAARQEAEPDRVTLTFGQVSLSPGWVSIVPGRASVTFDLRATTEASLDRMIRRLRQSLARIRRRRGVTGRLRIKGRIPPVPSAPGIRRLLQASASRLGQRWLTLASGGLHDACQLSTLAPVGMVFVPSVRGLSHTPAELTSMGDLARGAAVLADTLVRLARADVKP
jgi:hydantoinase/carbamoylase family amidase